MSRAAKFFYNGRDKRTAPCDYISGEEAAKMIVSAPFHPYDVGINEVEAARLGIKAGSVVSVAPVDTGILFATIICTFLLTTLLFILQHGIMLRLGSLLV